MEEEERCLDLGILGKDTKSLTDGAFVEEAKEVEEWMKVPNVDVAAGGGSDRKCALPLHSALCSKNGV